MTRTDRSRVLKAMTASAFWSAWLLLAGCRTVPLLPPVNLAEPGWRIRQGQAFWRPAANRPELTGDLLVATHPDGRALVQFTKTPLPFIVAQATPDTWQIQFVPENKTYSGRGECPSRLIWLYLPKCLAGQAVKNLSFSRLPEGKWRLANPLTGEILEGFLTP